MKTGTFIIAQVGEIQELVAEFLDYPGYNTLVADMRGAYYDQMHEGYNDYEVKPEKEWVRANHEKFISEVQTKKKVNWDWELLAILEELALAGKIEFGEYLIEVRENG